MTEISLPRSAKGQTPLDIAVKAAKEAGGILKDRFSRNNHVESKGKRNLVTESDLLAEKSVLSILRDEFPDHNIQVSIFAASKQPPRIFNCLK